MKLCSEKIGYSVSLEPKKQLLSTTSPPDLQQADILAAVRIDEPIVATKVAREGVVYSLRTIMLPEIVRKERHKQIRQQNMQRGLYAYMQGESILEVAQRMSERGYFSPDVESFWVDEFIELVLNQNKTML